MDMLRHLHVRPPRFLCVSAHRNSWHATDNCVHRSVMKVPDPWLGPKGVRLLLAARGFVGWVLSFSSCGRAYANMFLGSEYGGHLIMSASAGSARTADMRLCAITSDLSRMCDSASQ